MGPIAFLVGPGFFNCGHWLAFPGGFRGSMGSFGLFFGGGSVIIRSIFGILVAFPALLPVAQVLRWVWAIWVFLVKVSDQIGTKFHVPGIIPFGVVVLTYPFGLIL